jgi:hypothetical protein
MFIAIVHLLFVGRNVALTKAEGWLNSSFTCKVCFNCRDTTAKLLLRTAIVPCRFSAMAPYRVIHSNGIKIPLGKGTTDFGFYIWIKSLNSKSSEITVILISNQSFWMLLKMQWLLHQFSFRRFFRFSMKTQWF